MKQSVNPENTKESMGIGNVRRCGVCKVDLKGRFVYVDEVAQSLLGYSDEELFGKPLAGFVQETQRPILVRLIEIRSYYESFYESAALTLVHRDGSKQEVTVVFSLNFIAGNPANYQIIFDQRLESVTQDVTELTIDFAVTASSAITCISGFRDNPDWETFTRLLVDLSSAELAIIYRIDGKKLNPLAAFSPNATNTDSIDGAPKTKGLHRRVSKSGELYDFTNEDSVRRAIETEGNAPDEFLTCLETPDGSRFLVRLCFDSDNLPENPNERITRVASVLELVSCLAANGESKSRNGQATGECKGATSSACDSLIKVIEELSPGFTSEWVKKSDS